MLIKKKYFFLYIIFIFLILLTQSNIVKCQDTDQYKVFIVKGEVRYFIPNFNTSFPLIDNSLILENCKIITDKKSYLEIHSQNNLIRVLPSTTIEFNKNILKLISGTIYINTIDKISLKIENNDFIIYKGIIAVSLSKNLLFNFISDGQIEFNSQIYKPTKTDRIYTLLDNTFQKTNTKFVFDDISQFSKITNEKISSIDNLIDIFFERIFQFIDKNNTFIEKIENSEKKSIEIEEKIKSELELIKTSKSNISDILNKYSEVYQIIQEELIEYNFNKTHYLEFYFQMKNYFEYFKRLIESSNDIYDLDKFGEFPDYSSKSSFLIAYNKIKTFTETVRLSYEVLEITYVNILDSNSPLNKTFSKIEILKTQIKILITRLIKDSYSDMPDDINSIITQTFLTQLECKSSTSTYLNQLFEILLNLKNEYIEDEKIINKFFSLDEIIYKSLYLKQANDIKERLLQNFKILDKNIIILKYLSANSNLFNNPATINLLNSIVQFYPSYEEDYLSVISIVDEIDKSYDKYLNLLKFFLTKKEANYYQSIFAKEIDKYLSYLESLQKEIFKTLERENIDYFYLNSLIDIQEKIISVSYFLYEFLKEKFSSFQFPKKLYIDQQKEYLKKLKSEIQNQDIESELQQKNEEIKKYLIIRIVSINQILYDISNFKESIKDYKYQKINIEKALILYNLSLSNKNSFSSSNLKENISLIWLTDELLYKIDDFLFRLNNFEIELKGFFDQIQEFYLQQSYYSDEDITKIYDKISSIQKLYNEFTIIYFDLIESIHNFSLKYSQIESNNNDILIIDIVKDLKTFIFLYKTKFESFRYILSILRIIFSIE